jgi:peptide/nickel transport system permease protein
MLESEEELGEEVPAIPSERGWARWGEMLSSRGPVVRGMVGVWRVFRANPLTLVGFLLVILLVVTAVIVQVLPTVSFALTHHTYSILPYDPYALNPNAANLPPSPQHWLGTDNIGRDVFSRVLAALPLDLFIGIATTTLALGIGTGLGLVAGFWDRPWSAGGGTSAVIMRTTDVFLAFPPLILVLVIASVLGFGLTAGLIAILVTWWPYYVRLTRGEVLAVKHQLYVTAARASGVSEVRILFRHIVRNLLEPLIVYWTLDIGTVIIIFSTISFAGAGVQPPTPEWGSMINAYQQSSGIVSYPWLILGPGLAIFITVLAFSLLGDGMRDILDPRSRRILTQGTAVSTSTEAVAASSAPITPATGAPLVGGSE